MLSRFVRFAGHTCAVASLAAVFMVAPVQTASSDRPFYNLSSYGQTLATHVAGLFESFAHVSPRVRPAAGGSGKGRDTVKTALYASTAKPPQISRVVVEPGGYATLSGVATPGYKIAIQTHGRALGQTEAGASGHWQVRLTTALRQGDHHLRSVAVTPDGRRHWPGQDVRIALPQTLSKPFIVEGPSTLQSGLRLAMYHDAQTEPHLPMSPLRIAQADGRERDVDAQSRRQTEASDDWMTAPIFEWLRQSSVAYDQWIVDDLSGGDGGFNYVIGGRDLDLSRERPNRVTREDRLDRPQDRDADETSLLDTILERIQIANVQVREWLAQVQQSYRDTIVQKLAEGDRVSQERFVRVEPDREETPDVTRPDRQRVPQPDRDKDLDAAPVQDRFDRRVVDEPAKEDPSFEWPVIRDERQPSVAEIPADNSAPDPEKEALIRKAEEDAQKARELARKAAAQAEAARMATQELLAEEERLESDWAARRAAAESAEREAELKRRAEAAEKRAAEAEAKLKSAQALAEERGEPEIEPSAEAAAQRKRAEELAAAANEAANREFAAGRVREPPSQDSVGTRRASEPSTDQEDQFSVADSDARPRLSLKDSTGDSVVEEGSTLGEIDDFDPSVRYIYDMGDGVSPATKAKKRSAKKRRAKSRRAHRKNARKRRAVKRRAYRKRRTRYRRRARHSRIVHRLYRHVRRFGRLSKFKGYRRARHRRHTYTRARFMPRIRWRRR